MTGLIVFLNRVFRPPNVEGRESLEAYSRWEHELGRGIVRDYLEPKGDLEGKTVLDVGCGRGGKTVAYAEARASLVAGIDIDFGNIEQSRSYAGGGVPGQEAAFFTGDATCLPLADGSFDTVVANDAMEHFAEPERALGELARVTRRGGSVWVFFTPHYSPLGSHLYDYIYLPWCHLLLTWGQIRRAVTRVLEQRMEGADRGAIEARVTQIMYSYDHDLNHLSVRRFLRMVRRLGGLRIDALELRPVKFRWLRPATRIPFMRELLTGFVVCRMEKVS